MEATERPWRFAADHPQNACVYIRDAAGNEVACLYGAGEGERDEAGVWSNSPNRDAKADLIVRAVNQHEALLRCAEALRSVRAICIDDNSDASARERSLEIAHEALSALESSQ